MKTLIMQLNKFSLTSHEFFFERTKVKCSSTFSPYFLLFYNILSDCHYSDVINSLLNAFRLKKTYFKLNLWNINVRFSAGNQNSLILFHKKRDFLAKSSFLWIFNIIYCLVHLISKLVTKGQTLKVEICWQFLKSDWKNREP